MKHIATAAAGGLLALAGTHAAMAADLPLAEPVDYVRICDTWGNGFHYIPGTDTCLRISGRVRAEINYLEAHHSWDKVTGVSNALGRDDDTLTLNTPSVRVEFDARTQTAYGTLRSYIRIQGSDGAALFYDQAFIQFAGLTMGRAQSLFDMADYPSFVTVGSDIVTNQFTYTASFGNGFSASLGIEDRSDREVDFIGIYGGSTVPNVVGALRVDQDWGSAQLSGAVQQIRGGALAINPGVFASTEYGWAIQAAANINLPALAEGSALFLQASYSDGAVSYTGGIDASQPWNQGNFLLLTDAVVVPDGIGGFDLKKTKMYNLVAALTHYWTPQLRSFLSVQYSHADQFSREMDYNQWLGAATLVYSPVEDLDFGLEVFYSSLSAKNGARIASGFQPIDTKDRFGAIFRVERRF